MPRQQRQGSILKADASSSSSTLRSSLSSGRPRANTNSSDDGMAAIGWGQLEIREYPNILGDNPGVSDGCPLQLGWKHTDTQTYSVDTYEYLRTKCGRRSRKELLVPQGERGTYLLSLGYSLPEILKQAEKMEEIRESRRNNMQKGRLEHFRNIFMRDHTIKAQPRIVAAKFA